MNHILKIALAITALFVFIPAEKVDLPMGLIMLAEIVNGFTGIIIALLFASSFVYLLASAANKFNSKKDDILIMLTIFLFYFFYSFRIKNLIRFGNIFDYVSLAIFSIIAIILLIITIRRFFLRRNSINNN